MRLPNEITYESGREIHHDENVEWYTDMTIYEFKPKEVDVKGIVMKSSSSLKPTIFLLSGGRVSKFRQSARIKSCKSQFA
ncbi:MAG: hypothetical protein LC105_02015 [Chitinophagales bacterium]|nr:hypothetical protein [Chitinophagales bacterium]